MWLYCAANKVQPSEKGSTNDIKGSHSIEVIYWKGGEDESPLGARMNRRHRELCPRWGLIFQQKRHGGFPRMRRPWGGDRRKTRFYFAVFANPIEQITLQPNDHSRFDWIAEDELQKIMTDNKRGDDPEIHALSKGFALLRGELLNRG